MNRLVELSAFITVVGVVRVLGKSVFLNVMTLNAPGRSLDSAKEDDSLLLCIILLLAS
mgnify:CR=1 FL=1